jgi:hypothetical protein
LGKEVQLFMLTAVRKTNDYPHFIRCLNAIALSNFYYVKILLIIVLVAGSLSTLMGLVLLFRFRWNSGGPMLWPMKSFSSALAPFLFATETFCAIVGIMTGSVAVIVLGIYIVERYLALMATSEGSKNFQANVQNHALTS